MRKNFRTEFRSASTNKTDSYCSVDWFRSEKQYSDDPSYLLAIVRDVELSSVGSQVIEGKI